MSARAVGHWSTWAFVVLFLSGLFLAGTLNYVFSYERSYHEVDRLRSALAILPVLIPQVLVLYFVLRPLSFNNSWQRVLAALGLFGPWMGFLGMMVVHAPGAFHANIWWLLGVNSLLVLGLLAITIRWLSRTARRRNSPPT